MRKRRSTCSWTTSSPTHRCLPASVYPRPARSRRALALYTWAIAQTCSCLKQSVGQSGGGSGDSSPFFELILASLHQPKVKLQRALERQSGHLPERKTPPERGQCVHLGT